MEWNWDFPYYAIYIFAGGSHRCSHRASIILGNLSNYIWWGLQIHLHATCWCMKTNWSLPLSIFRVFFFSVGFFRPHAFLVNFSNVLCSFSAASRRRVGEDSKEFSSFKAFNVEKKVLFFFSRLKKRRFSFAFLLLQSNDPFMFWIYRSTLKKLRYWYRSDYLTSWGCQVTPFESQGRFSLSGTVAHGRPNSITMVGEVMKSRPLALKASSEMPIGKKLLDRFFSFFVKNVMWSRT